MAKSFFSGEFDRFYKDEEIVRHHIVRHTSQQNGVTQCMNMNLVERAHCMLYNARLKNEF